MPTYTIQFTQQELQALAGLLDAGVRATGLRSARDAAALLVKLEAAQPDAPEQEEQA